ANEASAPHPRVGLYGIPVRDSFPTWIHPNELIDGSVTPGTFSMGSSIPTTWDWQHHSMAMTLYQHHGIDLNFGGVILKPSGNSLAEKELMADRAAKLASELGANGAIVCWMGSGQRAIDPMLTLQACERLRVATTLVTWEHAGPDGKEPPLVYTVPEANAMVSTGTSGTQISPTALDQVDKVIGSEHIPAETSRFASLLGDRDFFGAGVRTNVEF
ncbi:glycine/sarcosine/betaine reductase component B subunit, partial [Dehalococcoidia bacterium]|nr:glycine/sarcosine/betaine reductase component B subunit [Dehalococcoidia bacterium]